jgi:phospholipase/carboxylesterase
LIFAIHGLGDRPENFARTLAGEFPGAARMVFPRGLEAYGDGFSWFPIPMAGGLESGHVVRGIREAGEALARLIERVCREQGASGKPVVFGFSQGGMLSFYLAAHHPDLVGAAVPIAAFLPEALDPSSRPAPVYAFHGERDELIAPQAARATVRRFVAKGGVAEIVEYPHVGHAMSVAMMRAVQRRVADLAADSAR